MGGSLVILLVVMGSAGSVVVPGRTITSPYHGLVSPAQARNWVGCNTTASFPVPWRFDLTTGIGSVVERGRAVNACPIASAGNHAYSEAQTYGGASVALNLGKLQLGTTRVTAKLGGQLTLSSVVSDGGNWACGKGLFYWNETSTYEEWNYRIGPSGGYYANWWSNTSVFTDYWWSNGTAGNAVPPSPFPLTNTTYYAHAYISEKSGSCEAVVTSSYNVYALVYDATKGTYLNATNSTWPAFGYVEASLANGTDFGVYDKNVWNGPTTTWTNVSGPYSNNASGFLATKYTYPQGNSSFWYNSSLNVHPPLKRQDTYVNSTVLNLTGDTEWYNYSFVPTDHYYLLVFIKLNQMAWTYDFGYKYFNGWLNSRAAFTGNAATNGNGIRVISVTER